MDLSDVRFVAETLAGRIAGDRELLERVASTDLMRLSTLATALRRMADGARPPLVGAAELMAICRHGGGVCDVAPDVDLQKLVDSLQRLAAEPIASSNRADRRARAARLPRAERRRLVLPPRLVH